MKTEHSRLLREGKPALAYHKSEGAAPTVVFFGGFRSDMDGTKALRFEETCRKRGQSYLRLDYSGHGSSDGRFEEGTICTWLEDVLDVIDALTEGPLVLVGSSMGGWLALLTAQRRSDRVQALVGLAAAPDFTEEIYRNNREACDRQFAQRGWFDLANDYSDEPYVITRRLVEESRSLLLLKSPFRLGMKVRLVQGMKDTDVPWETALRIRKMLLDNDVSVYLLKNADHRLSGEEDLAFIDEVIAETSGFSVSTNTDFVACRVRF